MKNIFILLVLVLSSCGNKEENKKNILQDHSVVSEDWELSGSYFLKQLRNEEIYSEEITFQFDEQRQEVRGNAGCNTFSATYERTGNEIDFQRPVSTKQFCEGKMETEQEIFDLFSKISEVREDGDALVFLSEDNEPLLTVEKSKTSE